MDGISEKMLPSSIRFSQDDICRTFTYGDCVHDVIDQITEGFLSIEHFLPLRVAFCDGHWYADNNRTLYVCRVLEHNGRIGEVTIKKIKKNQIWRKRTTTNEGKSIAIRGEIQTRPHSIEEINEKKSRREMSSNYGSQVVSMGGLTQDRPCYVGQAESNESSGHGLSTGLAATGAALGVAAFGAWAIKGLMDGFSEEKPPSSIRFSQGDINSNFTLGENVHDVINKIARGSMSIQSFLPMEVASIDGLCYTANNRTLYVCRVLEYEGKIDKIKVKEINQNKLWHRWTTKNQGKSVTIRGGIRPRPHSIDDIERCKGSGNELPAGLGAAAVGFGIAALSAFFREK